MAVCGHQFQGEDVTDWILSTSASCLDGSTTASQILQELFKRHCTGASGKGVKKSQKPANIKAQPGDKKCDYEGVREEDETLVVKKIEGRHGFENFDESQHLSGCPMKWLYNKKLLEKNKRYKVDRICYRKLAKKEEVKREKCKNLRDKTPIEVKIHKINLIEKYTANYEESYTSYQPLFVKKVDSEDQKELETHKRKLAAKLNWKFHDETPEESSLPSSDLKHNYLPPRPMLGLNPFLSLLLAPNQMSKCCSLSALAKDSAKKEKVTSSLSIQNLDLPVSPPQNSHSKITNASGWSSQSWRLAKKPQIPRQTTINLDRNQTGSFKLVSETRVTGSNPMIKKVNYKPKQSKSLSALFYELKDKSNFRNQPEECFENIKNLVIGGEFKIRTFLNMGEENLDLQVFKIPQQRKNKHEVTSEEEFNLVCNKIRFCEKRFSSQKAKSAGNGSKMVKPRTLQKIKIN